VRGVHGTPPRLCGLDELERHRDSGGPRAGPLGDPLTQPDGGEGRLDRIGGTQVDPVLGRVVIERQEHVHVLGDLRDRLGPLGAVVGLERFDRRQCVVLVLGVVDLRERGLRAWVRRLRKGGKNIGADMPLMRNSA
jgi:hypothetical protein